MMRHRSRSTLDQVMAWCLTAPSTCLYQCWLITKGVLWGSPESNFPRNFHENNPKYVFGDYTFKMTTTSPMCLWVRCLLLALKFPDLILHIAYELHKNMCQLICAEVLCVGLHMILTNGKLRCKWHRCILHINFTENHGTLYFYGMSIFSPPNNIMLSL